MQQQRSKVESVKRHIPNTLMKDSIQNFSRNHDKVRTKIKTLEEEQLQWLQRTIYLDKVQANSPSFSPRSPINPTLQSLITPSFAREAATKGVWQHQLPTVDDFWCIKYINYPPFEVLLACRLFLSYLFGGAKVYASWDECLENFNDTQLLLSRLNQISH